MGFEHLIVVSLSIAATSIVIVVSCGIVIHKVVNTNLVQRKQSLYFAYSDIMAGLLLQEVPAPLPSAPTSALFKQYELMIKSLKEQFERMTPRRRRQEREALRLSLIDFAKDISGEVSDRLIYFFYSFGFVDEQITLLSSRNWWIRAQAARDAGLLKARRAITSLTAALEDEHPDVRIQAMESLARLVGVESLRTILRVSRNLSQWSSIELSSIVMEYSEAAVPYLIEGLESKDQSVLLFCIEMLAEIGFISAVEPLRRMASAYPNVVVRAKAIEALGRLGDERAEVMLTSFIDNSIPAIRLKSIEALGRIGAPNAVPRLLMRLQQGELSERILAARAIGSAGLTGRKTLQIIMMGDDSLNSTIAEQVLEELDAVQERR